MLNIQDFMQTGGRPGRGQHPGGRQADERAAPVRHLPCCGCCPSCSSNAARNGDPDKPKLVFFFDEAHLLFNDAQGAGRAHRTGGAPGAPKGVGVYFVTQNPLDIPDTVLAQLGNRVQHALRAFTPRDQKAVKATATTMRQKPGLDIQTAITELAGRGAGELSDAKGRPCPPASSGPSRPSSARRSSRNRWWPGSEKGWTANRPTKTQRPHRDAAAQAPAATGAGRRQLATTPTTAAAAGRPERRAVWFTGPARRRRDGWRKPWPSRLACTMAPPWAKRFCGVLGSIFGAKASGADFKKAGNPTKPGRLPAQASPGVTSVASTLPTGHDIHMTVTISS